MNFDKQVALTSCLLLYQSRQDKALGMEHITARQRGLLWYYNRLKLIELDKEMGKNYLYRVIQDGYEEIRRLVKKAERSDDKQEILKKAIVIQKQIEVADELLKPLLGDGDDPSTVSGNL